MAHRFQDSDSGIMWFVAITQPHKEHVALENLERQSFRPVCPWIWKSVKQGRRTVRRRRPAFPGYVFVGAEGHSAGWRSITGTRGVRTVITDGEGPLAVKPGVVETLLASMDDDGFIQFARDLRPGQPARLLTGPFSGQLGVIETLDAGGRARLLISLMGRETRVQVMSDELAPVNG